MLLLISRDYQLFQVLATAFCVCQAAQGFPMLVAVTATLSSICCLWRAEQSSLMVLILGDCGSLGRGGFVGGFQMGAWVSLGLIGRLLGGSCRRWRSWFGRSLRCRGGRWLEYCPTTIRTKNHHHYSLPPSPPSRSIPATRTLFLPPQATATTLTKWNLSCCCRKAWAHRRAINSLKQVRNWTPYLEDTALDV